MYDGPAYTNQTSGYNPATTIAGASIGESPSRLRDGVGGTEQLLSDVHEAINVLEKRLDTVLTPAPPTVNQLQQNAKQMTPMGSHLSGRVLILNEGFGHAVARLRELAQRVEV